MSNTVYIYESPDKGKTIFRREFGKTRRYRLIRKGDYVEGVVSLCDWYRDEDAYQSAVRKSYTWVALSEAGYWRAP